MARHLENHAGRSGPTFAQADGFSALGQKGTVEMDCETAALFRSWVRPLFEQAANWNTLIASLRAKGFGLAIRDSRLVMTKYDDGRLVCPVRFLGLTLRDLAARLGRPIIAARRDNPGAGDFLNMQPVLN